MKAATADADEATTRLEPGGPGWVAIRSATLGGETIVFARDERVIVPAPISGCVKFSIAELAVLVGKSPPPDADLLRFVAEVKRTLGGRVVDADEVEIADEVDALLPNARQVTTSSPPPVLHLVPPPDDDDDEPTQVCLFD